MQWSRRASSVCSFSYLQQLVIAAYHELNDVAELAATRLRDGPLHDPFVAINFKGLKM